MYSSSKSPGTRVNRPVQGRIQLASVKAKCFLDSGSTNNSTSSEALSNVANKISAPIASRVQKIACPRSEDEG